MGEEKKVLTTEQIKLRIRAVKEAFKNSEDPYQFFLDLGDFLGSPGKNRWLDESLAGLQKAYDLLKTQTTATPDQVQISDLPEVDQVQISDLPEVDFDVLKDFSFHVCKTDPHLCRSGDWHTFEHLERDEGLRKEFIANIKDVRIAHQDLSSTYPQIKFALAKLEELLFGVEPETTKPAETAATSEASALETKSAPKAKSEPEAKVTEPAKDPVKEIDPEKIYFAVDADWYSLDEIEADVAVKGLFQKAFTNLEKGFVRVRKNRFAANVAVKDKNPTYLSEELKDEYRKLRAVFLGPEAAVANEPAKVDAIDPEAEAAIAVLLEEPTAKLAEVKPRLEVKYSTCRASETFVRLSDIDEKSLIRFSDCLEKRLPFWVSVDGNFYEMLHYSYGYYTSQSVSDHNLRQRLEQYVRELVMFVTTSMRKLDEVAKTKLVEVDAIKPAEVAHDPQAKLKLEPLSDEEIDRSFDFYGLPVKYSIGFHGSGSLKDIRRDFRIRQEFRKYRADNEFVCIFADGGSVVIGEANDGLLTEEMYRKFRGYLHLLDRLLFATDCGDEKKPEKQDHPKPDEKSPADVNMKKSKVLYGLFGHYFGHTPQSLDEIRASKDLCERYRKAFVEHVNIRIETGRDMFTMQYRGSMYQPDVSGYWIGRETLIKYLDELWEVVFECEGIHDTSPHICQSGSIICGRWVAESYIQKYPRLQEAQRAETERRQRFDAQGHQTGSSGASKRDAPYPMDDVKDLVLPKS